MKDMMASNGNKSGGRNVEKVTARHGLFSLLFPILILLVGNGHFSSADRVTTPAKESRDSLATDQGPSSQGDRLVMGLNTPYTGHSHEPGGGFVEALGPLNPPPIAPMTTETLPAGTWIIAMDEALQGGSNNRVRDAYGLAVRLLHGDVPLKWIIDPNKTSRTAVDFSASARERFPSNSNSFSTRNFRTGPLAIFPGYEAQAQSIISSYGNDIRVYELENATTVPVHSDLTHKPFVFVEQDENPDIHTGILSSAGLIDGTHYTEGDLTTVTASSCVTIITVPHNDNISSAQRQAVKDFTRGGGNFFAQCAGVRGFQDDPPRVFSNAGFVDEPGLGTFLYDNPQEPSAQFEGNVPDEGGSLENFAFNTDPPGGTRIVHDSGNDFKAYTGRIDGFTASAGGYVHYLGGHDYDGDIDADRYYLNAVLRSAERPSVCGLEIDLVNANDDSGTIDCGNGSVTINVLANDDNPQGGSLTVNLLGSGSNGTFDNNNDGTVTYTANLNGTWQGDQITYEACDGTTCDQATITITGPNPNQNIIAGTVFADTDQNGTQNGGETGTSGIQVQLYQDDNNNNQIDAGEPLLQTTNTSAGGDYSFSVTPPATGGSGAINNQAITFPTSNDAYEFSNGDVENNEFEQQGIEWRGWRFTNVNIPANATITSAQLQLTYYDNDDELRIKVEENQTPSPYSETNSNISNRPQTSAFVDWDVNASQNDDVTSPDFTAAVQEAVNSQNGLTHLSIIAETITSFNDLEVWNLDDGNSSRYPRLTVTWTVPPSATNYVVQVNTSTLPTGATLTTPGTQEVDFNGAGQLSCNNDFGYIACVTPPDAGSNGNQTICEGTTTPVNLFSIITGEDAGGTWTEASGSNSGATIGTGTSVDFSGVSPGTYQFTYTVTAPNCPDDMATATVTVEAALDAGTNGTLTICEGESFTTADLFNALGGSPDPGGDWSPAPAGAGTYTYTHAATANCPAVSAQVVVTEETPLNAGTNGTLTICVGESFTTTDLFNALGGSPDPGGDWSPAPAGAGTYTYTHAATANCPASSAEVVVTAEPSLDAGTNGTLTICEGEAFTTTDLFNALGGSPDPGGDWSPAPAGAGTYTYTHPATANCAASSAEVVVTAETPLDAGTNGTLNILVGETVTTTQLFNALGGSPDPGGDWSPAPAGAGTYTYTHPATANCPASSAVVVVTEQALEADLAITKTVDDATPEAGGTVVFTLTVTNNGPSAATGVEVTDLLPTGVNYVSHSATQGTYAPLTGLWTIGNLSLNGTTSLTITATVNAAGSYVNIGRVMGNEPDPDLTNNVDGVELIPDCTIRNITPRINNN